MVFYTFVSLIPTRLQQCFGAVSISDWLWLIVFFGKASYGIEDHEYAVTQLAQTTMRSELGKYYM